MCYTMAPSNKAGKKVHFYITRVLNYTEEASRASTVNSVETQGESGIPEEASRASTVDSAETQGESGTPRRAGVINIALSKNELARQASNEMTEVGSQVQQELADLRTQVSELQTQVNANEVRTLRAENANLRRLLSNTRSNNNPEQGFPPRELDILTSNTAKIGNRASQVETLQMEFEILKGRVKWLEADRQATERQEPTRLFGAGDLSPNINMSPTYRKRTSSEAGLRETDLAKKLPVVSVRPSLSPRTPQLSTRRRLFLREAAEPEGGLPESGQSHQPSLPRGPRKKREPGGGERN
ncbi:hypothetical protein N0V85_000405 [Neurospora sp. IMI 360204]|nr:hypothetical protein N0V85_000405 [Neurospora sp. IMI 360204]